MNRLSKETKETLQEIVLAFAILEGVILLLFCCAAYGGIQAWPAEKLRVLLGILSSGLVCLFVAVHMTFSVETAMELGEEGALRHVRWSYGFRVAVVLVVAFVCYLTRWVDMLAFALGLLVLKPAIYLHIPLQRILGREIPETALPETEAADISEDIDTVQ